VKPTSGRPFDLAVDWTVRPNTAVKQIQVQQPALELALFGPQDMLYGQPGLFTIQLTNPGTGDAENVTLEFVYGQQRLSPRHIGTVAAGEQTEVDVELTAAEAGTLQVSALATGEGGLRAESEHKVLVRRGQLDVEIAGAPVEFAGKTATYEVRVSNTGNATASGVSATLLLPRGAKLVSSGEASNTSDTGMDWQLGSLSPGSERTLRFACELTAAGDNVVEAQVRGDDNLTSVGNFTTHVKALADLKLLVNDPQGPIAVGENAVFEIRIVNRGTKAAEQINVVSQFSEGIEPVEAHGGPANIVPGQVLFHPITRVAPGQEILLKVIARATQDGNHRFRAQVTGGDPETRLVAEESTYFFDTGAARTARKD
jgi:uncharacterized repeat protein (TIGR01451 family)